MNQINVSIHTPFIKLDQLLKFADLTSSGGEATIWIKEGRVSINGEIVFERGKKIKPGMHVLCKISKDNDVMIVVDAAE